MKISIQIIAISIHESDTELDIIIQDFLNNKFYFGEVTTVAQWRLDNYADLRRWAYPDIQDYLDSVVKIKFKTKYKEKGDEEMDLYLTACENVKIRFPKE